MKQNCRSVRAAASECSMRPVGSTVLLTTKWNDTGNKQTSRTGRILSDGIGNTPQYSLILMQYKFIRFYALGLSRGIRF